MADRTQEIYDMKPITTRDSMLKHLVTHGLFANQAEDIVKRYEESKDGEPMKGRWDSATEGYPPTLLAVLRISINVVAVEYIDENCPGHFARHMFA